MENNNKNSDAFTGKFWDMFRFTQDGKPKSSLIVNTFSLSILLMAGYAALYYFLADPMATVLGGLPHGLEVLLEAVIPALIGAAITTLLMRVFRDKRIMPIAYLWLFLYAAAALIAMLIALRAEPDARAVFMQFFAMLVPAPVLLGGGLALWYYYRCSPITPEQ